MSTITIVNSGCEYRPDDAELEEDGGRVDRQVGVVT